MATKKASKATKKPLPKPYTTLHDLLIVKLQALHDVENQIIKALPKLAKAATDPKLKQAFTDHLKETEGHEARIDRALELLGDTKKGKIKSEAIRGLADDGSWVAKNVKDPAAKDAMLIAAAQYVENYEIAGYGTAIIWAQMMGHDNVVDLLKQTLDEEKNADDLLSSLAEESINDKVDTGMNNSDDV